SQLKDEISKAEPGNGVATAVMIDSPICEIRLPRGDHDGGDRIGEVRGSGGATGLIIDHLKLVPFSDEAQQGPDEVCAVRAVNPRCAQDDVSGTGSSDGALAFCFANSIGAEWGYRVIFEIGLLLSPIKDIVCRNVDERHSG